VTDYHLAQLNVGVIRGPMDSPIMADFANNLDRINALAEASDGFIWRLKDDAGNATAIRPFEQEDLLLNMSVWRDIDRLRQYVYRSAHVEIMRRRKEFFEPMDQAFLVLWWVPAGHIPGIEEAVERLERLRRDGATPEAFSFREAFAAPGAAGATPKTFDDACPA